MNAIKADGAPFIKSPETVRAMMADVVTAMIPAAVWAVWRFGAKALLLMALSVSTSVLCEGVFEYIAKKRVTVGDLSAVVTGLLIAFGLPVEAPWYVPIFASVFAIIIVKCAFGGLGANVFNPALAGVVFVRLCFRSRLPYSSALTALAVGKLPEYSVYDAAVGLTDGAIGEVSAMLLTVGGLYLIARSVIDWRVPVLFVGTVAALSVLFPQNAAYILYELFSGSLFLGAVFMATDPTTTPVTGVGRCVFAVGAGALTYVMRRFGGDLDGVAYAILAMNMLSGTIDRIAAPRSMRSGTGTEAAK